MENQCGEMQSERRGCSSGPDWIPGLFARESTLKTGAGGQFGKSETGVWRHWARAEAVLSNRLAETNVDVQVDRVGVLGRGLEGGGDWVV